MKKAALPLAAAVGGMFIPAIFYVIVNASNPENMNGWGVPMATDIAFALNDSSGLLFIDIFRNIKIRCKNTKIDSSSYLNLLKG